MIKLISILNELEIEDPIDQILFTNDTHPKDDDFYGSEFSLYYDKDCTKKACIGFGWGDTIDEEKYIVIWPEDGYKYLISYLKDNHADYFIEEVDLDYEPPIQINIKHIRFKTSLNEMEIEDPSTGLIYLKHFRTYSVPGHPYEEIYYMFDDSNNQFGHFGHIFENNPSELYTIYSRKIIKYLEDNNIPHENLLDDYVNTYLDLIIPIEYCKFI